MSFLNYNKGHESYLNERFTYHLAGVAQYYNNDSVDGIIECYEDNYENQQQVIESINYDIQRNLELLKSYTNRKQMKYKKLVKIIDDILNAKKENENDLLLEYHKGLKTILEFTDDYFNDIDLRYVEFYGAE